MRELPSCLADHLKHSGWHAREQIAQPQLLADDLGLLQIRGTEVSSPAHKQVEGERLCEHVILVELRRGGDALAPALHAERMQIESIDEQLAGVWLAQSGQDGNERRFSAAGWAFEHKSAVGG